MEDVLSSFPPYYQAARTHDRTETEIDFPVGLTPQPSICIFFLIVDFSPLSISVVTEALTGEVYNLLVAQMGEDTICCENNKKILLCQWQHLPSRVMQQNFPYPICLRA